ncbi:hypothetical protein CHGG_05241 [Chaetomium globosum CBS 148.51]|uniref:Heterokaryon incompatibility domain-containing protein n=1 Tax=Chaetomium globosum (strain ATCC 6205 / CBS 148.51 / DSM 1962 / NBRC 6347 / NRRL 1970) TaxID=306901 RepID=Q2GZ05_CHAGB|nr:uncharacterized protein CHGG_05241 [Chaetomium globosum CBS 148.51]EAQ88622.1 hypothetical protein CHGG_05241 [Chaetomium globosum CBS 148.51]
MRLLDTLTLDLGDFTDNVPLYAILSHRWSNKEPTLQDSRFCSVAASHGFQYGWVDTCCIDKTSSAELSEAINSMYRWYKDATICFVYLGDVGRDSSMLNSPFLAKRYPGFSNSNWFSRGWTLQEPIAPSMVVFLDDTWQEIDTKYSLRSVLSAITGIPDTILGGASPYTASIAQRMSWASNRETTRVEDTAYSLMGLFDVNMPMLYGEGEKAFLRLQQEIIKTSDDHSIFAWEPPASNSEDGNTGLLATSPAAFAFCGDIVPWDSVNAQNTLSRAISTDNKGIHLKLITALLSAVLREHGAVAKALIDAGADAKAADEAGQTALHYATETGQTEIVKLLLDSGADVEHEDVDGNTALILASQRGYRDVERLLTRNVFDMRATSL